LISTAASFCSVLPSGSIAPQPCVNGRPPPLQSLLRHSPLRVCLLHIMQDLPENPTPSPNQSLSDTPLRTKFLVETLFCTVCETSKGRLTSYAVRLAQAVHPQLAGSSDSNKLPADLGEPDWHELRFFNFHRGSILLPCSIAPQPCVNRRPPQLQSLRRLPPLRVCLLHTMQDLPENPIPSPILPNQTSSESELPLASKAFRTVADDPGTGETEHKGNPPNPFKLKLVPISPESFGRYMRERTMYVHAHFLASACQCRR
jgi:hypothetical protein